ncbi:MAG: proline dehydrogenase family protein [Chloroflexi bacterium]|nr:proline dehydrogenase family protein [Chloroflexota bacterium]MCI0647109.1 proline dehydrogenase family protein [Chloroflexota bacterium]
MSAKKYPRLTLIATVVLVVLLLLLTRYGGRWLRFGLVHLARATWARNLANNWLLAWRVASRFVAGETIDDALAAARDLNGRGMLVSMDYLGESVTEASLAHASRDEILRLLDCIRASGVQANVSVKLSQLGLKIRRELALDNMIQILERAGHYNNRIRIDMEESALVDTTLGLYRTLRDDYGFQNVGVVIQAYLYRSEADVRQLIGEGAWVRLCKGAYAEPPDVAFPVKADTDANFVKLVQLLLGEEARRNGVYLGVATHDEKMIQATINYAQANGIRPSEFEFQMLYGIRRELQERLVRQGYQLRIYVPYGTAWYPYFVRRLAERPANLWFFISNLLRR